MATAQKADRRSRSRKKKRKGSVPEKIALRRGARGSRSISLAFARCTRSAPSSSERRRKTPASRHQLQPEDSIASAATSQPSLSFSIQIRLSQFLTVVSPVRAEWKTVKAVHVEERTLLLSKLELLRKRSAQSRGSAQASAHTSPGTSSSVRTPGVTPRRR